MLEELTGGRITGHCVTALIMLAVTIQVAAAGSPRTDADIREALYPILSEVSDGQHVREVFERAFADDREVVPELLLLVEHSDVDVAREAAIVVGRFHESVVTERLKAVFRGPSRSLVRVGALFGLLKANDQQTVEFARSALQSKDYILQLGGLAESICWVIVR